MAISQFQFPGMISSPAIDFTPLSQLGAVYRKAQDRQTLAELGRGLSDGTIDYRTAAGRIAETGDIDATTKFLQLAEARRKQEEELAAGNEFMGSLRQIYGGGGAPSAGTNMPPKSAPATVPQSSTPIPSDPATTVPARAPVASSPRVWGDQEAEAAGIYEPRTPAQQQPVTLASLGQQPPGMSPRHAQLPTTQPRLAQAAPTSPQPAQVTQAQPAQAVPMPESGGLTPRALMLLQGASNPRLPQTHREMAKTMLSNELDASKLTTSQKEYVMYRSQGGTDDFTTWDRGNKAAGKTEITVDNRAENEENKAAGKGAGERRATMFASAGAAHKTLANLSRVEGLLNQVSQGKMQPARMTISAWAKSMGLSDDVATSLGLDPKGVGSAEALQALTSEMVIGKIGSGGFPANNFSDADRSFLLGTVQQLGNDPRANKIITETARRMANLDIERAKEYQAWKKDPANANGGFEDFELYFSDKMARRDVFGDLRREAEQIVGAPRDNIGGTYQNPGAAPARSQGNNAPISVKSPEDARRLPPGTRFTTPDGREFTR